MEMHRQRKYVEGGVGASIEMDRRRGGGFVDENASLKEMRQRGRGCVDGDASL